MKKNTKRLIKFTATSILVVSLFACGGADERKVKYLEKGKVYLAENNIDKARVEIKNVLQIDPKFAEAYFLMGQLEEKNKELRKALGNYNKAIELNPDYAAAKIKLAKIYVIAGTEDFITQAKKLLDEVRSAGAVNSEVKLIDATIEYKVGSKTAAIAALESVVKEDENQVEAISLLTRIYLITGEELKALSLLKQGADNNSQNVSLRILLAKLLVKNKKMQEAEGYLKQAIKIEPEQYSLQVALSSFYIAANQIDKSEQVLRNAIAQDDMDAMRYLVLVEMLSSRVSLKKADEELKAAIRNKPDLYQLRFSQVKFYEKLGRRDDAKSVLKEIITEKSHEVEGINARNQLAHYLLEEGDKPGAQRYVDEVMSEYPNNNDALLISSKLALMDLDAATAINGLRTIVKNEPKNAEASLLLAQAHELNKESSLAENELKKAIEANPVNDQVHANYARYLASKGRIDEAVSVIDKALAYFKNSYDLLEIKLKIVASKGDEKAAVALLDLMEQANASKSEVNVTKGKYYLSKGQLDQAIEQFEKAYQKSQDKFKPLQLIVRAYISAKQVDKAIERLNENLKVNADDPVANLLLGQVYFTQKKMAKARAKFSQASKAAESWFLPYSSLATSYMADKNEDKALAIYQGALNKIKNKVPAQLQIASIYELKKNFTDAMSVYKEILLKNPSNKLAANNYASLLLDYGQESDALKALELAKTFEKLEQPALQDTLGWAYARTGNNAKAIEILKPVVEKAPKIAVFRYHLGYALYEMGNKAAAKSHLEIAANSEQQFSGKEKAGELLKLL